MLLGASAQTARSMGPRIDAVSTRTRTTLSTLPPGRCWPLALTDSWATGAAATHGGVSDQTISRSSRV
jgi:hypothetical protein